MCVAHVCTMYGEGRAEKLTFKAISLYQVVVVVCVWLMCVQCMEKIEWRNYIVSSLEIGITVFIYLFSFANITWENNKTKIHTRTQKRKKILFGRYTTTALANYCGPVG